MPTKYEGSPVRRRALDAYIKLTRATNAVASRLEPPLSSAGLSPRQLGVLEALLHLGSLSQRSLSEKMLCSPANITVLIDQLETGGLVIRQQDPEDRRVNRIAMTRAGEKKIRSVFEAHVDRITILMGSLTSREQTLLADLCRKLGLSAKNAPTGKGDDQNSKK